MGKRRPISERFWEKVATAPALECWEWQAALSHGYGVFSIDRKRKQAHRVAYELMIGPIPPLLVLDHLCHNSRCVNPYHLDPVPLAVNSARSLAGQINAERQRAITHCPRGHDYSDPSVVVWTKEGRYRICRICKNLRRRKVFRRPAGSSPSLTTGDVAQIDEWRAAGVHPREMAQRLGVDITTIYKAIGRRGAYGRYPYT